MITCYICERDLLEDDFYMSILNNKRSKRYKCKRCVDLYKNNTNSRLRRAGLCVSCGKQARKNKQTCEPCSIRDRKLNVKYVYKLREEVYEAYGGAYCACCGEQNMYFLTLHHVNNDGAKHRKEVSRGVGGTRFYLYLRRNNYPKIIPLQVYCYNCQGGATRNKGICPHIKLC